jgi:hypothetical protein
MTAYYVVAVDDNGDVMAARAVEVSRAGLDFTVRSDYTADGTDEWRERFAFENQGADPESVWEAARDALTAVMPDECENIDSGFYIPPTVRRRP